MARKGQILPWVQAIPSSPPHGHESTLESKLEHNSDFPRMGASFCHRSNFKTVLVSDYNQKYVVKF